MKWKINFLFIFCISIFSLLYTSIYGQEPIWAKSVSSSQYEYGIDADIDSHGNIFYIGYGTGPTLILDSNVYNANGDGDAFIVKLSKNGQLIWLKNLGGDDITYSDKAMDIHLDDNDNVILLVRSSGNNFTYNGDTLWGINSPGWYSGEGVIIKIDNNGNYLWHDDGSVSSSFQGVTTDSNGNIYLTGWYSGSLTLGNTLQLSNTTNGTTKDLFVAKYSPSGVVLWGKNAGGTVHNSFAYGHNIEIDEPSGKIVVMGRFENDIYFDTGVLSANGYSTYLVSYSTNGTELWKKIIFNPNSSYCHGLDISPNGIIGVAGYSSLASNPNGLVGFYDLNGNVISEEIYSSPNYCRLHSLEFNYLNECYISGEFRNSISIGTIPNNLTINANSSTSGLILKLNSNQVPLWAIQRPTSSDNKITCKNYRTLFSGRIDYPFIYNFGTDTLTNNTGDAFFTEISDTSCPVVLITDKQSACDSATWMNGNTYTKDNNKGFFYIPRTNTNNCDTLISLDLTINKVSDVSTTVNQNTITANNASAIYKWIDCNNNHMIISGEVNQSYTPVSNGSYAVQLEENGCIDTSDCKTIISVGIFQNDFGTELKIYPNPSKGNFSINLGSTHQNILLTINDLHGKKVLSKIYDSNQVMDINITESAGIYLLNIESENKRATIRLVID